MKDGGSLFHKIIKHNNIFSIKINKLVMWSMGNEMINTGK